jgi:hypothetical protein
MGAFVFNGRNFCQVLEGHKTEVRALLEEIRHGERHNAFKVIDEKPVMQRHFADRLMEPVDGLDFSISLT